MSPELDDCGSPLTFASLRSSIDNQTLYGTPEPMAASTVARPGRMSDRYKDPDGLGSFLLHEQEAMSDSSQLGELPVMHELSASNDHRKSAGPRARSELYSLLYFTVFYVDFNLP